MFWAFALLFYVGAILVDDGKVEYENFFTSMFAILLGAMGVGQVRTTTIYILRRIELYIHAAGIFAVMLSWCGTGTSQTGTGTR